MESTPTTTTAQFSDMLSLRQVAALCGVSVWTVRRWMEDDILEGHRPKGARAWKIREQDVRNFLANAERKGGKVRKPRGPVDSDTALSSVETVEEFSFADQIDLNGLGGRERAEASDDYVGMADQIVFGPVQ